MNTIIATQIPELNYPNVMSQNIGIDAMTLPEAIKIYGQDATNMWHQNIYGNRFKLESRRYIGCKTKLIDWIFDLISSETKGASSFCDIFAGTGVVAHRAMQQHYTHVIMNDFLYSNNVIYKAFFQDSPWDELKIFDLLDRYNGLNPSKLNENYFSKNYGGKFFDTNTAKIVGYIREDIKKIKPILTEKEYAILLASLIYSIDKLANTLGHFDAYIKKDIPQKRFVYRLIDVEMNPNVEIHQEDSNMLAKNIHVDITYIDPPYNSRQYSRFYHVYENLIEWKKPSLHGTAMKPAPENMSEYCRSGALKAFTDLVSKIDSRYLVVSYNNTYKSKSKSSENKIKLEEIKDVLEKCGRTKVFSHDFNPFNSGKTEFDDHKEYLFITEVDNKKRLNSFASILCR